MQPLLLLRMELHPHVLLLLTMVPPARLHVIPGLLCQAVLHRYVVMVLVQRDHGVQPNQLAMVSNVGRK